MYWLERFVASTAVGFAPDSVREVLDYRIVFKGYQGSTVAIIITVKNQGLDCLLDVQLHAVVVLSMAGNAIDTAPSLGAQHT